MQQIESAERAGLAPLKAKYAGVIMGYDFHGKAVDISVDLQAYDETDDDKIASMEKDALRAWRREWLRAHPRDRGTLTVKFLDFRANVIMQESIQARS